MFLKICDYTQTELDYLQVVCNFTDEENTLFLLRSKDIPLEECAERMQTSVPTISRLHKRILSKIKRES